MKVHVVNIAVYIVAPIHHFSTLTVFY